MLTLIDKNSIYTWSSDNEFELRIREAGDDEGLLIYEYSAAALAAERSGKICVRVGIPPIIKKSSVTD
jgi:hypothetical protein